MDVLLHQHSAKYIYGVPEGLRELMSDISREVLRCNPKHIYSFIADYLDALIITRENARVAAKFVDSITELGASIVDLLIRTGISRPEADKMATVIQVAFRKYHNEKAQFLRAGEEPDEESIINEILDKTNVNFKKVNEAAKIIQNAYRAFKKREELASSLLKGMVDWRRAASNTLRLYQGVVNKKGTYTIEEANRNATIIKAAYKGYYTRRIMKNLLKEYRDRELKLEANQNANNLSEKCKQTALSYEEQFRYFQMDDEQSKESESTAFTEDFEFQTSESMPCASESTSRAFTSITDQASEFLPHTPESIPLMSDSITHTFRSIVGTNQSDVVSDSVLETLISLPGESILVHRASGASAGATKPIPPTSNFSNQTSEFILHTDSYTTGAIEPMPQTSDSALRASSSVQKGSKSTIQTSQPILRTSESITRASKSSRLSQTQENISAAERSSKQSINKYTTQPQGVQTLYSEQGEINELSVEVEDQNLQSSNVKDEPVSLAVDLSKTHSKEVHPEETQSNIF